MGVPEAIAGPDLAVGMARGLGELVVLALGVVLTADILAKVDRMSMATSLEVRVPMLDHEFVEWVAGMPIEWKFRNGTRKYILKKLAKRLGIPSELLHRRKQGFQLPLVEWMRDELKEQFLRVLLEPRTLQRGYFKPQAVRTLVDEHLTTCADFDDDDAVVKALDVGERFDERGELRPLVNVYVNSVQADDLEAPLEPETEIRLVAAVAGG